RCYGLNRCACDRSDGLFPGQRKLNERSILLSQKITSKNIEYVIFFVCSRGIFMSYLRWLMPANGSNCDFYCAGIPSIRPTRRRPWLAGFAALLLIGPAALAEKRADH